MRQLDYGAKITCDRLNKCKLGLRLSLYTTVPFPMTDEVTAMQYLYHGPVRVAPASFPEYPRFISQPGK
jgi:hypothetical protein